MSYWELNKKRILAISILQIAACYFIIYYSFSTNEDVHTFLWATGFAIFCFFILYLLFFYPAMNSFKVIQRLTDETEKHSIVPLFDPGYTIGLQDEKSWILFTTPCINATISGLPVLISYFSAFRDWSQITFKFFPLMREGSKRICVEYISFNLYFVKRLKKDIKPDVLKFVADAKAKGLTSGVGRTISTIHHEAYAD